MSIAPATYRQVKYIRSLTTQHDWSQNGTTGATITEVLQGGCPDRVAASAAITYLLGCDPVSRPKAATGYYRHGDTVYAVVNSRSRPGAVYAKRLVIRGTRGHWVYARGVARDLAAAGLTPLSLSEAARLGHQFGVCVCCGRTLTDPQSVERGIGPVCAKRL